MKRHETETHRRLMAGESIPAYRPADRPTPTAKGDRFYREVPRGSTPVLDFGSMAISAETARAVAQEVNAWCKSSHGEIDGDQIRLVCQWVLRETRAGSPAAIAEADRRDAARWRAIEGAIDSGQITVSVEDSGGEKWDGEALTSAGELQDWADARL